MSGTWIHDHRDDGGYPKKPEVMSVKRYGYSMRNSIIKEREHGQWVTYADYQKLEAKRVAQLQGMNTVNERLLDRCKRAEALLKQEQE